MARGFEDHFSRQAKAYARHRPRHPEKLIAWIASLAPSHGLAWDCGTGNGQVATALASHFERVIATDASAEQITHASPHARVEYRVEPSERSTLADTSVDLVTVAAAVHWFDLDPFYEEVRRVAKPGAVVALWTYWVPRFDPAIDALLERYATEIVGRWWPERMSRVMDQYRTLPFPFDPIPVPPFEMSAQWDLDDLEGFIDTWSATQRALDDLGRHPLDEIHPDLVRAWGPAGTRRTVVWPLYSRFGRV